MLLKRKKPWALPKPASLLVPQRSAGGEADFCEAKALNQRLDLNFYAKLRFAVSRIDLRGKVLTNLDILNRSVKEILLLFRAEDFAN